MSEPKSKCCNASLSGGSGYFYVTTTYFPRIKGNPLNLPGPTFICSKCKKPCEVKETSDE
jgi:hypothetical protein